MVDQFGALTLDLLRPLGLLVPSAKSVLGPPIPLAPDVDLDHYTCYQVRESAGTPRFEWRRDVQVVDQFGTSVVDLLEPVRQCAPANKNGESPGAPAHLDHLLCYRGHAHERFGELDVNVLNQFGDQRLDLIRRMEVCVPALAVPPELLQFEQP